jgi:predicted acyl esterase
VLLPSALVALTALSSPASLKIAGPKDLSRHGSQEIPVPGQDLDVRARASNRKDLEAGFPAGVQSSSDVGATHPALTQVRSEFGVMIPMRDGVKLAADVWLPDARSLPRFAGTDSLYEDESRAQ